MLVSWLVVLVLLASVTSLPEVSYDLVLAIPNENGRLIISPAKKRVDRPRGAKNKHKSEGVAKAKPKVNKPQPKIQGGKKLMRLMLRKLRLLLFEREMQRVLGLQ